ncbi:MAG TPA: diaminopimelate decarboxylase [Buchnera sp. (in: enterobacteria)]|nr:diaminopimelate decarboxylase [Buchnera sp. (in: enterobacteria)]
MNTVLTNKKNDLNIKNIISLIQSHSTPMWIYDAQIIKHKISQLKKFDIIRYAQKACSNIHILKIMHKLNVKIDAVSLGEIKRALVTGFKPHNHEIIFTADIFDEATLFKVVNLNITINAGSIDMLQQIGEISPGHCVWLRINPKFGHGHSQKTNTGGENSKHGIWRTDLAIDMIKKYKLKLIGIHMHIGSGVDYIHLSKVCDAMVDTVINLNHDINAISAGGGIPIPYKSNDKKIDTEHYFTLWNNARQKISNYLKHPVTLEIEPGRFLVAESGILLTQVRAVKKMGNRNFVLVDAGFNDLLRPAMYGSYHHISAISKNGEIIDTKNTIDTIVGGPLCESGDIFTQKEGGNVETRALPIVKTGDYLILHNTGAYGASMSSNYNSRPLIPEILFNNGVSYIIRKRQSISDLIKLEKSCYVPELIL